MQVEILRECVELIQNEQHRLELCHALEQLARKLIEPQVFLQVSLPGDVGVEQICPDREHRPSPLDEFVGNGREERGFPRAGLSYDRCGRGIRAFEAIHQFHHFGSLDRLASCQRLRPLHQFSRCARELTPQGFEVLVLCCAHHAQQCRLVSLEKGPPKLGRPEVTERSFGVGDPHSQ